MALSIVSESILVSHKNSSKLTRMYTVNSSTHFSAPGKPGPAEPHRTKLPIRGRPSFFSCMELAVSQISDGRWVVSGRAAPFI